MFCVFFLHLILDYHVFLFYGMGLVASAVYIYCGVRYINKGIFLKTGHGFTSTSIFPFTQSSCVFKGKCMQISTQVRKNHSIFGIDY